METGRKKSILIDKEGMMLDGTPAMIMTDLTSIVDIVTTHIEVKTGISKEKLLDDIFESLRFTKLVLSGMNPDEAFKVITGKDVPEGMEDITEDIISARNSLNEMEKKENG